MDSLTIKQIKIALLLRDWTLGDLAREIGITPSYLSMVLKGKRKALWVWKAVSKELSLSEAEVI
ncbi:MAG: helix-turn-helix domain-containing protein [Leptospirillum sp.]